MTMHFRSGMAHRTLTAGSKLMEDRSNYKIAVIGAGNLGLRIAGESKKKNPSR